MAERPGQARRLERKGRYRMCGRFVLVDWYGVEQRFDLPEADLRHISERYSEMGESPYPRYNIAPTQEVLAVRNDGDGNRAEMMRWGLVPSWAKDQKIGNRMINARSETLSERPSFRAAYKRRRCVIVADSFYEWKREGKSRTPMRIMLESEETFAFAGLWETWKRPDDSWMLSCTIITTSANELVSDIHDRMPVILDPDVEPVWLDPDLDDTSVLSELLVPYPSELMTAYEVSRIVNSAANDVPECILPIGRLL